MPNFNRANISETLVCLEINRLIEQAAARTPEKNNRRISARAQSAANACDASNSTGCATPNTRYVYRTSFAAAMCSRRSAEQHLIAGRLSIRHTTR